MIAIEKNVPFPTARRGPTGAYPFHLMVSGDSFFVPGDHAMIHRVQACMGYANRNLNKNVEAKRFASRAMNGGIRVWRIR